MTRLKVRPQSPDSETGSPSSYRLMDWTLEIEIVDGQIARKDGDHTRRAIVHSLSVVARRRAASGRRLVPDGAPKGTVTWSKFDAADACVALCT